MRNKYEIFALLIISVFIIFMFLIKPAYTGFAILEVGEKIYVSEAIYKGENATEGLITLDEIYVEIVTNKTLLINFSDFLENGYELNMFLSFEKDNSSMTIYNKNNITVGFVNPYEIYPNETIVEEVKWYNKTLNLSSSQNEFFIEVTKEVIIDYIEATAVVEETTTTTTTTVPSNPSSESEKPANKVFIYEREKKEEKEEEPSEEIESEEKIESENIIEETKTKPQIQADVIKEIKEEPFIEEVEKSNLLKTVGNIIVKNVQRPSFIKFSGLIICGILLFMIYYKNRTKLKKKIKKH